MTDDEIIELGTIAAGIVLSPYFVRILEAWELDRVANVLATKPEDIDQREHFYAQLTGVKEFVAFMADFAAKGRDLQDKYYTPKPEDIDDPSVHDIYREDDHYTYED